MARPKIYQKIFSNNGLGNSFKHEAMPTEDKMPSQSGQDGKFLTTDGSNTSWGVVNSLPEQSASTSNKFLKSTGTTGSEEWATVDALPSQEGQNGKFLTTDGSSASWDNVPEYSVATQSANGLMSSEDKTKLDGVEDGAQVNTVTSVNEQTGAVSVTPGHSWCSSAGTTTSTASSTTPAVVVENYVNGTSWYRVWSDGWIEQGGITTTPGDSQATKSLSFVKNFSNTNYVTLTNLVVNNSAAYYSIRSSAKTVSSFSVSTHSVSTWYDGYIDWYACGY